MYKEYDIIINLGRLEPCHVGHIKNTNTSLDLASVVIVLLGSANQPTSPKNPFTISDRTRFLTAIPEFNRAIIEERMYIRQINDYLYNDSEWISEVQEIVKEVAAISYPNSKVSDLKIAILGHEKDGSSYYLRLFPTWKFIEVGPYCEEGGNVIDATRIRQLFFEGHLDYMKGVLHPTTYDLLLEFKNTEQYETLRSEYEFYKKYKKQWSFAPYPVQFMTTDAVVIKGGHLLLVRRKALPGKGLWALPGGFVNVNETCKQAAIRELMEETLIKVPKVVLENSITYEKLFDHPNRSLRGRTITMAYLIELNGGDVKLPRVKGADDAEHAKWFSFAEVLEMSSVMFDDHYSIIKHMIHRSQ